jgi:hypothetical protein
VDVPVELLDSPLATAMASNVSEALTVSGLLYTLEDVVGVVPLLV